VVVVTRPAQQAGVLAALLEERGARAVLAPAIALAPADGGRLSAAATRLADGAYEWVVLTSRAGVDAVFEALGRRRPLAKVAAIGDGTADAIRARGVQPDLIPSTFTTDSLGDAMPRGAGRVLLARADIAPPGLDAAIASKGWTAERVDAYRTTPARTLPDEAIHLLRAGAVDALTFTSASTVDGFVRAAADAGLEAERWPPAVCIGPVTAAACRDAGLSVAAEGDPHTIQGLVGALERVLGPGRKEPRA
jgi:uroporphyrinogen-III synthase